MNKGRIILQSGVSSSGKTTLAKARGNRNLGQAARQLEYVHKHEAYDLEVDTFQEVVEQCARRVVENERLRFNPVNIVGRG